MMKRIESLIIPLAFGASIFLMASPCRAAIHNLGTFDRTYPIAERDALEEIKERVAHVDWGRIFNRERMEKAVKAYRPDTPFLPRARHDIVKLVDMAYTLDVDIPDGKGGILYPKGYTFNPLDYVNFQRTLVVINGDDVSQVAWFSQSDYSKNLKTMLLLTGGSYYDLGEKLARPVFYVNADIVNRLQLEAVPSIVHQKGRYMEVKEVAVPDKKSQ
jgi:conjugal transfer pilus assembly protein TraW